MNYDAIKIWIDVLQFLWMVLATIWVFWGNKSKEANERVSKVEKEVADHLVAESSRIARIEEQVKHIPSHDEMRDLTQNVSSLQAQMESMNTTMKGVHRQLELINEYLLHQKTS